MKKTLLAAALLAGFAGAAQADTTVTLYGVLDTGIEYLNARSSAGSYSAAGLDGGGVESGSRLGVKGLEDLGGGNQAWFNMAMGFNINDGGSLQGGRTFGRNALVGLQNPSWGRLQLGRGVTVANNMMAGFNDSGFTQNPGHADPFSTGSNILGLGAIASALNINRWDNMIGYTSPIFGGLQLGADYSFNAGDKWSTTNAGYYASNVTPMGSRTKAFDLAGTYNNGPLFLGVSYSQENAPGSTYTGTVPSGVYGYSTATTAQGSIRQLTVAGSYDFTVLRVYGAYVRGWNGLVGLSPAWSPGGGNPNSIISGATFKSLSGGTVYSGMKQNAFMLGVSAPVTANLTAMADYMHETLGGGAWAAGSGSAMNIVSAGGIYKLSKRTNVYSMAGYVDGAQGVAGQKETVIYAGINHSF